MITVMLRHVVTQGDSCSPLRKPNPLNIDCPILHCKKNLLKCQQLTCSNSSITWVLSCCKLGCAVTVHDAQSLHIKRLT
jgi:hypothetical protein